MKGFVISILAAAPLLFFAGLLWPRRPPSTVGTAHVERVVAAVEKRYVDSRNGMRHSPQLSERRTVVLDVGKILHFVEPGHRPDRVGERGSAIPTLLPAI